MQAWIGDKGTTGTAGIMYDCDHEVKRGFTGTGIQAGKERQEIEEEEHDRHKPADSFHQ